MMSLQQDLDLAAQALATLKAKGADGADVIISGSQSLSLSCRLGEIEDFERAESRDIGLRALIGQQQAFVSASGADPAMIELLADRAVAMARTAPADPFCGLAASDMLAQNTPDLDLLDEIEPTADHLQNLALKTEAIARSHAGITNSEGAGAAWGRGRTVLATSAGFAGTYETSSFSLSCAVLGGNGDAMERDYASHSTRHFEDLDSPTDIGNRAATRTLERLKPRKVKSGKAPVIFDERVSASLVGHLLNAISGTSVARGTSFLRNEMGQQILSDGVTLIDDPLRLRGLRSAAFDGEGLASEPITLVENGILKSWLLDTATAKQLSLTSNARAGRGIGSPPSPSATNVHMEAGPRSVTDMMQDIKSGLLITELIGMGVNGVTGDYSRGAAGFWIENGEIAYPVSEVTIASNLREMFKILQPAGNLNFRRGVNAPSILVPQMSLAGL
jgi:PmbA protein